MNRQALLDRYDIIVFDCDGVLFDSNDLKSETFRSVLNKHGFPAKDIEAFIAFQTRNFGISRYKLFESLLAGQFGGRHSVSLELLLEDFGTYCRSGYLKQAETRGMREALERSAQNGRVLYVVSGGDEEELICVLGSLGIGEYFAKIYGSPTSKIENLRKVRAHWQAIAPGASAKMLFVGDAEADFRAALEVNADFIFMAAYSKVRQTLEPEVRALGLPVIENLTELI